MTTNQPNTQPIFIERTGSDNPFDYIDVGRDAAPILKDHDGDGDLDLFVAHGNGFSYFQNVNGQFVEQLDDDNPLREVEEVVDTFDKKFAFAPKNEAEDYLIASDAWGNYVFEFDAENNIYREVTETESPLTLLPGQNVFPDRNTVFISQNPRDPAGNPAIGFINYLTGKVEFFVGETDVAGNYVYQMLPRTDQDHLFRQFNFDVDQSSYHSLQQGPQFSGVYLDLPVGGDFIVVGGETHVSGATQFNIGNELYQAIGHSHLSYPDITFYRWNANDSHWEYMPDAHPIFFGRDEEEVGAYITLDAVDFDGDGDEDLIVGNEDGIIQYFENTGGSPGSGSSQASTSTLSLEQADDYIASHPDLIATFGYNLEAAQSHYAQLGAQEGRAVDTFAEDLYLASNPDLISAFGDDLETATQHYIESGHAEGRNTSLFNPEQYLMAYSDLQDAFGTDLAAATRHYIEFGYAEGRDPLLGFDSATYLASYDDLIAVFGYDLEAARQHYIQFGAKEGRTISFQADDYIASYDDLIQAFGDDLNSGTEHFIRFGMAEGRARDTFDEIAYLDNYADLQAAFGNNLQIATQHYLTFGFFEGRTIG